MRQLLVVALAPAIAALAAACDAPTAVVKAHQVVPSVPIDTASPPVTSVVPRLAVESFTVIEFRPTCVGGCNYLVYAPMLKLRETGGHPVEVTSIVFKLGMKTTGDCRGSSMFAPGASAYLDGLYDYLWSNDLLMVSLDGTPVADTIATARATLRSPDGTETTLEATGSIQRLVPNPVFPPPRTNGWICTGGA